MTQEERDILLAKAERNYPMGTVFESAYSGSRRTRESKVLIWDKWKTGILDDDSGGYVYDNEKWAVIVSLPEIKTLPIFN